MWMNRYDIEEKAQQFRNDPVLGPATRFLQKFMCEVDNHSDGWPYWSAPSKSADKLMKIIHTEDMRQRHMTTVDVKPPTIEDVRKSLAPIKSFMTKRGNAAGMTLPELE